MDLQSYYYFSELAKDLHFTRAAERLYISQQTLSNHIARLEKYYGIPLVQRHPSVALTQAGEEVLIFANLIMREHGNLRNALADIGNQSKGVLNLGTSSRILENSIPNLLLPLLQQYPAVDIRIFSENAAYLEQQILDSSVDLAILDELSNDVDPNIFYRPLINDQVFLCVSDTLLKKHYGNQAEPLITLSREGTPISRFQDLPFSLSDNLVGQTAKKCFYAAQIKPNSYISDPDNTIGFTSCCNGITAYFTTKLDLYQSRYANSHPFHIFPLLYRGEPIIIPLYLVWRKGRYLSHYVKFFKDLLINYFDIISSSPLSDSAE